MEDKETEIETETGLFEKKSDEPGRRQKRREARDRADEEKEKQTDLKPKGKKKNKERKEGKGFVSIPPSNVGEISASPSPLSSNPLHSPHRNHQNVNIGFQFPPERIPLQSLDRLYIDGDAGEEISAVDDEYRQFRTAIRRLPYAHFNRIIHSSELMRRLHLGNMLNYNEDEFDELDEPEDYGHSFSTSPYLSHNPYQPTGFKPHEVALLSNAILEEGDDTQCFICNENMSDKHNLTSTPQCNHKFCEFCIKYWLCVNRFCPVCLTTVKIPAGAPTETWSK